MTTTTDPIRDALEAATSSVFNRDPAPNEFGGYDVPIDMRFGRAASLRITHEDAESASYDVYVFDRSMNVIARAEFAGVPLTAILWACDAMVRSA